MTFRVGQKVVCVDDKFDPRGVVRGTILPVKDQIYTIRAVIGYRLGPVCMLYEIQNCAAYLNEDTGQTVEAAFPTVRFRPIVERKTDISIFTSMLNPKRVDA